MAIGTGFSKTATDGLIFGYDTGDKRNSFKGKDTTNLLPTVSYAYGNQDSALFKTNYGTETVNIPAIGEVTSHYVNIYNDYNGGSGNCCLSLFAFGNFAVSPSTVYTYQIIYKTTTGYSHPNYMYHYEYGPGGYVTEYGLHSTSREVDLGDGWKMGWGTFTSNANTNSFTCYLFHYEYGTYNKVQLAGIMLTQGSVVYDPLHFLPPQGTRSSANVLKDVTNTYTLDVSNMSYATEPTTGGDMIFDATNDVIDTNFGVNNSLSQVTMEAVVYDTKNNGGYRSIIQNNVASDDALYIHPNNTLGFWPCTTTYLTVPANRWAHVVYSYDGTTMRYSVNGAQHAFTGTCADCLDFDFLRIGAHSTGDGERFGGKIAVAKVYNRALTEGEIDQNFRHYATRFGIKPIQQYYEGADATNFVNNWNNTTTYYMAQFGGLGPVTAHGFSSGPVNYTLTLPIAGAHSRIRYRVKWHMVDSLDNETSRLYVGDGSSETEYLTFTKVYNAAPSVSYTGGPLTTSWSGHQTYSYRPWANGAYGADGYLNIDSGWIDHTSSTLTVRHYMGADQAQADEAMYLSHVEVLIAS
jgi:hypothetical protein